MKIKKVSSGFEITGHPLELDAFEKKWRLYQFCDNCSQSYRRF